MKRGVTQMLKAFSVLPAARQWSTSNQHLLETNCIFFSFVCFVDLVDYNTEKNNFSMHSDLRHVTFFFLIEFISELHCAA